jgi:hypothetical protein
MAAVAQTILCLIIHPFFEDDKMENIGNVSFWLFKFLPINIHDPTDSWCDCSEQKRRHAGIARFPTSAAVL